MDDHAALAELLARVVEKVDAATGGALGTGAVMLYDGTKRRPNAKTADALARKGLAAIGLRALLKKVGGDRVSVLHPGVAVGRLVRVPKGKTPRDFGPDVIAVYDAIPDVAPTFAGIITLEPQTPLSHINLLAKNRGTVNLSAQSIGDIAGLEENMGKAVRLVAKPDKGRGGEISIRPISAQALAAATRKARSRLAIPKPKRETTTLLALTPPIAPAAFDAARRQLVRRVGAKATGYALLHRLLGDDAVRPASALTFGTYLEHARRSGARAKIHALYRQRRSLSKPRIADRLTQIRKAIEQTPLRPAVVDKIARHLAERYPGKKVRLRSSTNCEDLPAFNGAGLYVSKGLKQKNVDDTRLRTKLEKKLKAVFASLWSERAYWEREYAGIDERDVAMAILIHPAFVDEWGDGVALTLHDDNKSQFEIVVQAQRGGGGITHASSGQTPESFVHRPGRAIPGRIQSRSSQGDVLLVQAPKTRAALALFLERMAIVDAAFVPRAASDAREPTQGGGKGARSIIGVDVEFKVMHEDDRVRIFFKQARLLSTPLPGASPQEREGQ